MKIITFALAVVLASMLSAGGVRAQGVNIMQAQTRAIERAVEHNTERLFKPRLKVVDGDTGPVTAMALSGDEHYLVSAVGNNTIRLWDLAAGREIARLKGHSGRILAVAVSADGKRAASAAEDRTVRVWSLDRPGESVVLARQEVPVTGLAFSPDGDRLATAAGDGSLRLWSVSGGTLERTIAAHERGVVRLAFTADGRLLSAGADGRLAVWNAADGGRLQEWSLGQAIHSIAVSGNSVILGTAGGSIQVWDLAAGSMMASLDGHAGAVTGVALSGGTIISGGADGTVRSWSLAERRPIALLGKHDSVVSFIAGSRDGTFALSSSEDGTIRLWNVLSAQLLVTLLSTETGWAVVDALGRYEGSQQALGGIAWQADDASVPVEDLAEGYYQPGLLAAHLQGGGDLAPVKSIPDGIHYPAKVSFATPTASGEVADRHVSIEVVAEEAGGALSELRLYRNGRLILADPASTRRETTGSGTRLIGRYEVELTPGQTVLSATAVNEDKLESRPKVLTLKLPGAVPTGAIHVLAVGINHYRNDRFDLNYAKPDAAAIASFFADSGMAAGRVAEVRLLSDAEATKGNILAALAALRHAPADDVVVVYLAGHGVSVGDDWYFIPHEVENPGRRENLAAHALSSRELKAEIEALTADHVLLLLDTCHSGTAVIPLTDYRGMKTLRLMARSVGTHILAATDRNQFAVELQALGHGIFTYAVLSALTGVNGAQPADGVETASAIIRWAEEQVPILSKEATGTAQFPTAYSRGADFAVARPQPSAK